MEPYKISIVNYLNSAPFVLGISRATGLHAEFSLDHPAESAARLLSGRTDIALAPVAVFPELHNGHILTDYCIGTEGEVQTVQLFSEVPVGQIRRLYLDYQSRTSVLLARILCRDHWGIEPEMIPAFPGFQKEINGTSAGLIIGDRAIRALDKYTYSYDLGLEWKKHTGLPFVFAVWMSGKPVPASWEEEFGRALADGLSRRKAIARKYSHLNSGKFDVLDYLTRKIDYRLDEAKREGMSRFLELAATL